ncbi:hypothetical protein EVAR_47983_1 [Eumeta japonica]|uniref:HAT C-terminal dimerisation domain-containing protein n=1 Tax=Eumeta variegata TaxID=151549 RepID=A0A4C1XN47_EUMVA|nr:hypothetical protein EVAR_47983_1 [Eumeta japonica]
MAAASAFEGLRKVEALIAKQGDRSPRRWECFEVLVNCSRELCARMRASVRTCNITGVAPVPKSSHFRSRSEDLETSSLAQSGATHGVNLSVCDVLYKKHNYLQDSPTSDDIVNEPAEAVDYMDDNDDDDHLKDLDCSESDPELQVQNESGLANTIRREMSLFENGGVRGYHLENAYKYLISIPPTNVEPERAFSAAAYVGNKLRSRLGS